MSTDLHSLSEFDTLKPTDFCSVATASRPTSQASAARLESRFRDLGIVIERLFAFYQAMRSGKPVANGEEMLAQVRGALAKSTRRRSSL